MLANSSAFSSSEFRSSSSAALVYTRTYIRGSLPKVTKKAVTYIVSDFTLLVANSAAGSLLT